jgi:hypothetical protein
VTWSNLRSFVRSVERERKEEEEQEDESEK